MVNNFPDIILPHLRRGPNQTMAAALPEKNSYATGLGIGNKFLSAISWGERGWNIVVSNSEFEGLCCRPINSEIAAIMSALRELQLSQSTSSVSPRSEQKALAQEITKVVFHLSLPSCRLYVCKVIIFHFLMSPCTFFFRFSHPPPLPLPFRCLQECFNQSKNNSSFLIWKCWQ